MFERVEHLAEGVTLYAGDCLDVFDVLEENSVDSIVTDPPYELGFMGRHWDKSGIAFRPETWAKVMRVLKPGGHLVAFSAPKCSHRMVCAIEGAGFEIRDGLMWVFGSGFPKSLDVSKAIDKAAGAEREVIGRKTFADGTLQRATARAGIYSEEKGQAFDTAPATAAARQWQGWGTALKPAYEPICLARKPLSEGTVAANVLRWGTGALNIDATRIGDVVETWPVSRARPAVGEPNALYTHKLAGNDRTQTVATGPAPAGRWPANLAHDGSEEVVAGFPESDGAAGTVTGKEPSTNARYILGGLSGKHEPRAPRNDSGSAARFFYSAKADADDRLASKHPTVKPVDLMRWLVRLVTPPGGTILDPFAGTGTTAQAALLEGFSAILIEREEEYRADIARRIAHVFSSKRERREVIEKARAKSVDHGPLFSESLDV